VNNTFQPQFLQFQYHFSIYFSLTVNPHVHPTADERVGVQVKQ